MAFIAKISDEIIREIGMYFLDEKATLCALALTQSRIYTATRGLIFRKLEVWMQGSPIVGFHQTGQRLRILERYEKLMKIFEYQPELGNYTQVLVLGWGTNPVWLANNGANERATTLLRLTPNIRSLEIRNFSHQSEPFTPPPHLLHHLHLLQHVTTSDPRTKVHDVLQMMQLPDLQHLIIRFMDVRARLIAQNITSAVDTAKHLNHLVLAPRTHLNFLAVTSLLSIASRLESLSLNLPGLLYENAALGAQRQRILEMVDDMSPASIRQCIQPLRETLVELNLVDAGVQWPGHDGTRLNLRDFECMKRLSVRAACLLVPNRAWGARDGLFKLLPKNIEEINVSSTPMGSHDAFFHHLCKGLTICR